MNRRAFLVTVGTLVAGIRLDLGAEEPTPSTDSPQATPSDASVDPTTMAQAVAMNRSADAWVSSPFALPQGGWPV